MALLKVKLFIVLLLSVIIGYATNQQPEPFLTDKEETVEKEIAIGLLVPFKGTSEAELAARLAIAEANEPAGNNGVKFKLIVRNTEGPWGVGSKESVSFIYEDNVKAIVGALDSRNAHLAEQVAAKSHVIFMSTWATDPTLSQAYVPWYFRCIPNDDQQAEVLFNEIVTKRNLNKILAITTDDYDSRFAVKSLVKKLARMSRPAPGCIAIKDENDYTQLISDKITDSNPGAIVLFTRPEVSDDVINKIRKINSKVPVFGNISTFAASKKENSLNSELKNIFVVSSEKEHTQSEINFSEAFKNRYGYLPGAKAAYSYDGIKLIIQAIQAVGTDYDKIREYLIQTTYKQGVTGEIKFDDMGNRTGDFKIIGL
ncbi:MAG: ABC transporter substrate-binding protein [Bacteroidota bacterium]